MQSNLDDITAVVLAGGFGTRVKHLLPKLPKPMAPVAGKPFVEWVVRYLAVQGIKRVVLSTGYLAEVIDEHFKQQHLEGIEVVCYPETIALGTAGGFLNAVRQVAEPPESWLVLNGDSLVFSRFEKLLQSIQPQNVSGALIGLRVADASRYGSIVSDQAGRLLGFKEKCAGPATINAGVYLLRHSLLSEFPGYSPLSFETQVFPHWLANGVNLMVVPTNQPFLDIGTPESLPQAEKFILNNIEEFIQS
jgi:D-glycero-alpha-D-manno-heptose 1-phosphate guanylyltransferase